MQPWRSGFTRAAVLPESGKMLLKDCIFTEDCELKLCYNQEIKSANAPSDTRQSP